MVAQPRPAIQTVEDQELQSSDLKWGSSYGSRNH